MKRMQESTQDAGMDRDVVEADSRTSLEQLMPLLQGARAAALADAGLTSLDARQLTALHRLASHQAQLCVERRDLLQCLAWHCAEYNSKHSSRRMAACAAQVAMLEQECQRWITLAENARYYQQHPDVTAKTFGAVFPSCRGKDRLGGNGLQATSLRSNGVQASRSARDQKEAR